MMEQLLSWLLNAARTTPLELFVFFGSMLEEFFPPIPAPLIMSLAGYTADERGAGLTYLFWLAIIGAAGKVLASLVFYQLGRFVGGAVSERPRLSRFLGLSEKNIAGLRETLTQKWWDEAVLVVLRVVPIIPTFLLSITAGVIGLPLRMFVWTTFVGTVGRNLLLIALGIFATAHVQQFWETEGQALSRQPIMVTAAVIGVVIGGLLAFRLKRFWRARS